MPHASFILQAVQDSANVDTINETLEWLKDYCDAKRAQFGRETRENGDGNASIWLGEVEDVEQATRLLADALAQMECGVTDSEELWEEED